MDAQKKKKKAKGRTQSRQRRILLDPHARAYPGWDQFQGDWDAQRCRRFIQWCHIDKLFPYHRHTFNVKTNMANLHACTHDGFVQRCIKVYRYLYKTRTVLRNEAPLFICEMVYAEVILNRTVDWRTIKGVKLANIPTTKDIPKAGPSPNPRDGLGKRIFIKPGLPDYFT